jgi:tRNA pseudouridine55 synthase
VPPMVSAVKVGGRRLHELARAGEVVERQPRPVTVYRLDVGPGSEPGVFTIDTSCSAGTYVRVLAADLGRALGGGAHLRGLRRTAVGEFSLAEARPVEALGLETVLPPVETMRAYPRVEVEPRVADEVRHGRVLSGAALGVDGDGPWALVDGDGALLAVYEPYEGDQVKPAVVLV